MRGNVPARREDEEIGQRRVLVARLGGQHAEDGWVDVVDGDGADVDELGQIIFIGYLDLSR